MIGRVVLIADFGIRSIKVWKHHDEAKCERVCTTIWSLTKAAGIKQQLQSAQVPARDVATFTACSVTSRRHPPAMMISRHSPVGNWQGEAHVASCTGYTLLNIMIELLLNALLLLTRCIVAGQRRDAADVMMQGLHCRRESFVRIAIDINIVLMESFNSPKNQPPSRLGLCSGSWTPQCNLLCIWQAHPLSSFEEPILSGILQVPATLSLGF